MFYEPIAKMEKRLRFGDVVQGFHVFSFEFESLNQRLQSGVINMSLPQYCVVLTPCCSIKGKVIVLSPLVPVENAIFRKPFFAEEPTRINKYIEAKQAIHPKKLETMHPDELQAISERPPAYAHSNCFVYMEHELFEEYDIVIEKKQIKSKFYMVDFKNTYKVGCTEIEREKVDFSGFKVLQLSIDSREQLRRKISEYYGRVPLEDVPAPSS